MGGPFIHPQALVEPGARIGEGTRVWAFAHVLPGAVIGRDCNICDGVFVENDVQVGDRVTVKCGVQLWDGTTLEDEVFVGPNATFTNDRFPRSGIYPEKFPRIWVGKGASIGANATLLPGLRVGAGAMVGAGSVVTSDVPEGAVVFGNPARVRGLVQGGAATASWLPVPPALSQVRRVTTVTASQLPWEGESPPDVSELFVLARGSALLHGLESGPRTLREGESVLLAGGRYRRLERLEGGALVLVLEGVAPGT
jgi:acetyltransferase-like isoleucine patch superfamily enzyme